ncbi:31596_t:CDS:2 [Gigaspora margarita]|uniref:31596_t:CDS:1 n=1 Tax=Gigaspora margarita TaxID=4874 RepID=A0ABN7W2Y8_GIGMA|nr:31596_t:CDS:2 [Gigaspora margarita]
MRKVMEKKDTQEETECVKISFSTKQIEHMILDTHVDNKNDNIKENSYQHKEVAVNITHMATENQEIMHNPLQTDQISLDINTGNTKDHIPAPTASKVAKGISKKEGLGGANLKGKKKEHLTNDIEYMMKDRFMKINKAKRSRKMKTSDDYQVLKLDQGLANAHAILKDNRNLVIWKRGEQESEIDYIWISKEWAAYIIQASTKDMDLVTNSDHKLLITALDTDKKISMDKEWDIIQSSIIKAVQTSLPMKKKLAEMLKTENIEKTDILQLLRKCIRKLDTFCCRIRKRVLMPQEEKKLHELCKDIEKNYEINTSCEQTQDTEEKRQEIKKRIEERYSMIVSDQRRMLNSLLERKHNKIRLDRVTKTEVRNEIELIYNPKKIKKEYKSLSKIRSNWYEGLMTAITKKEWKIAMDQTKTNLVPGASGIPYPLLKNCSNRNKRNL